jgi:hypothetical protein
VITWKLGRDKYGQTVLSGEPSDTRKNLRLEPDGDGVVPWSEFLVNAVQPLTVEYLLDDVEPMRQARLRFGLNARAKGRQSGQAGRPRLRTAGRLRTSPHCSPKYPAHARSSTLLLNSSGRP